MNHTPKPWGMTKAQQGSFEAAPGITVFSSSNTELICRVSGYLQPLAANAQLIVLSPDMFEFVEEFLAWSDMQENFGFSEVHNIATLRQMATTIMAKLAKLKEVE